MKKNMIISLNVQKGINPYYYEIGEEKCEYMLHVMSDCLTVGKRTLVGLTLDETNKKVIRQILETSKKEEDFQLIYESYVNDEHYDMLYNAIYKDELSIDDFMLIARYEREE